MLSSPYTWIPNVYLPGLPSTWKARTGWCHAASHDPTFDRRQARPLIRSPAQTHGRSISFDVILTVTCVKDGGSLKFAGNIRCTRDWLVTWVLDLWTPTSWSARYGSSPPKPTTQTFRVATSHRLLAHLRLLTRAAAPPAAALSQGYFLPPNSAKTTVLGLFRCHLRSFAAVLTTPNPKCRPF